VVEEDAGARQKNYTALDHTDCLAVCRRAARLKRKGGKVEGNGREWFVQPAKNRDKMPRPIIRSKKVIGSERGTTSNTNTPTATTNQQKEQPGAPGSSAKTHTAPSKATTQGNNSTARHASHATQQKKTKKEEKNPQSNPKICKICNLGKKSAIAILSLYKDNSQRIFLIV